MARNNCIIVCVTKQKSSSRLITEGALLAKQHDAAMKVVHVVHPNDNFLGNPDEGEAMDYLFHTAKKYNATITLLKHANVAQSLVHFVQTHNANLVVLGQSGVTTKEEEGILWQLRSALPLVDFHVISAP